MMNLPGKIPENIEIKIQANLRTGETKIMGPLDLRVPLINILATAIQILCNPRQAQPATAPAIVQPSGSNGTAPN